MNESYYISDEFEKQLSTFDQSEKTLILYDLKMIIQLNVENLLTISKDIGKDMYTYSINNNKQSILFKTFLKNNKKKHAKSVYIVKILDNNKKNNFLYNFFKF